MDDADVERILAVARREIGHETVQDLGECTRLLIGRFAVAINDRDPLYRDPEYARSLGYSDVIAPPTMLTSIRGWGAGPFPDELRTDGSAAETTAHLEGFRRMGAGQKLTLVSPVVAGDHISVRRKLVAAYSKRGRSGNLVFLESESLYVNQHDEVRAIHRRTELLR
ncbi:MAG: MaoC family dehydratase N-terminal domain-containing protein [Planctomycetes bacterium]|nr:MaoC family dehydratase N-terminal domain-containing protein [Planctomycetota bacterium]